MKVEHPNINPNRHLNKINHLLTEMKYFINNCNMSFEYKKAYRYLKNIHDEMHFETSKSLMRDPKDVIKTITGQLKILREEMDDELLYIDGDYINDMLKERANILRCAGEKLKEVYEAEEKKNKK